MLGAMVAAITACADAPSRSGGEVATVELRSVVPTVPHGVGSDVVESINAEVEALSRGAMRIAIDTSLASGENADEDVLQRVRNGSADLGIVRAGVLVGAGLTEFRALQAPFLIDNEDQAARVATDPIVGEMLRSLDRLGLVGLAVLPGGLRHPVGYVTPLLGVHDYAGTVINTRPSPDVDQLLETLGARPDHSAGSDRLAAVRDGRLRGLEMSFFAHANEGAPSLMTINVVLYSKFDVIVINRDTLQRLTRAQRQIILDATAAAVPTALSARQSETESAAEWCALADQSLVQASTDELAGLMQAADAVLADMLSDPFTARAIDRIRSLAAGTHASDIAPCHAPAPLPTDFEAVGDQRVLDGTWRFVTSAEDLLEAGVPPSEVDKDVGVHTYVLENGKLSGGKPGENCFGTYQIAGDRLHWEYDPDSCGGVFDATFTVEGDHLTLHVDPQGWFFAAYMKSGLVRIGGVP